jgi:single-strand DNA-binding protein
MSTPVTLTGRLTADPEITFGKTGTAIARFSVVTSRRVLDKTSNEWKDEDTSFWNCTAFGALAENIGDSLEKGTAVIVTGRAAQESWEDRTTGAKRTAVKVTADEVAPLLRWANAKITKAQRSGAPGGSDPAGNRQAQPARPQQTGGWGTSPSDEAPF